jgi:hypothetical protein
MEKLNWEKLGNNIFKSECGIKVHSNGMIQFPCGITLSTGRDENQKFLNEKLSICGDDKELALRILAEEIYL